MFRTPIGLSSDGGGRRSRRLQHRPLRGSALAGVLDTLRVFSEEGWLLIRAIADGPERSYGWAPEAAQRPRLILDFGHAMGLRASELVGATFGDIETDARGDRWLNGLREMAQVGRSRIAAARPRSV